MQAQIKKKEKKMEIIHYPTLKTVLIVEDILKKAELPISKEELKRRMSTKIMHQTLNIILYYLEQRGMIIIGSKGILWVYSPPEEMKKIKKMYGRGIEL